MRKKVLIIGYVWVEPNSSAAGGRMLQLIQSFINTNYQVVFASPAQKGDKAIELSKLGVEEVQIELNSSSFDTYIKELQPEIVLFDRFMMEEQFGWRVAEFCPKALRILDTEDLHFLRKVRHQQLKKGIPFSEEALLKSIDAKREVASILRCDLSLIISSYEVELLTTTFKIDPSLLLYLPFMLDSISNATIDSWLPFSERENFVFIGNYFHQPNIDAVLELKKIWPTIRKKLPQAEVHVYGSYVNQQIQQLHKPEQGFLVKGFAENANEVVSKAKVVLAPIRFGAGIKGKLTEAMLCGTPSVTTIIGAEGMHEDLPWNGFITNSEDDFTDKAVTLYTDENVWETVQENGIAIINSIYNRELLETSFIDRINELILDLENHRTNNFLGSLLQHQTLQSTKYMSKWIEEKNKKETD
ncbi:glycosyltransferase involved in cell wall biosynthesis [Tenacibaculum skagerrakense]|uniref:Glycosyltransferase involved in cell wall biosynthesis n=1 Tax=Tenacibaculum skagerrakense TaxID=186571 RepID=A0A4R2P1Y9_9FLAO|nr:glycosyltransferase [Tenacibaculum skagerrakense]TCP28547.1 glycosyltransferase involved in cell wall biosynthesis [Tenacibaculum skagerrakense]